jgi:hypothetical protein
VNVESLERFAQNQRVIEEFTTRWLAPISGDLGRLVHVSMLRNLSSGRYSNPSLEQVYSEPAVHQALLYCHEELFAKVLEKPLEQQERDLRVFLAGMDSPQAEVVERWREVEFLRTLVPFGTPAYLRDLFFSNLRVILGLIGAANATLQTAA